MPIIALIIKKTKQNSLQLEKKNERGFAEYAQSPYHRRA